MSDVVPVVVVSYNSAKHLKAWLASVEKVKQECKKADTDVEPFIVDNGSSDGTIGIIWDAIHERQIKRRNVWLLRSNQYFVPAQNLAFKILGARNRYNYGATLNPDATAKPGWLHELLDCARKCVGQKVGMFGGLILQPDHEDRISSAGHCLRSCDAAFLDIDWNLDLADQKATHNKQGFGPFSPCFAAGLWSFKMLRDAGIIDNEQPMYYDDVNLAFKARIRGWSACFAPAARAYHPLPMPTSDPVKLRHQFSGRLVIAPRFFPDEERHRVLTECGLTVMSAGDDPLRKEIFRKILALKPVGSEDARVRAFDIWQDRYVPEKNR